MNHPIWRLAHCLGSIFRQLCINRHGMFWEIGPSAKSKEQKWNEGDGAKQTEWTNPMNTGGVVKTFL